MDVEGLMLIFVYSLPETGCSGFKHLSSGTADFGIQKFSYRSHVFATVNLLNFIIGCI